jgi:hypothetical protein
MVSSAIVQLMHMKEEVEAMANLGYKPYFLTVLGVWKLLGVVAILIPRRPLLKEWAYAGFFFAMVGAFVSQMAISGKAADIFPPILLILLTVLSWFFRPADRKIPLTTLA